MINLPLMHNNITKEDTKCLIDFLENQDIFTQNRKVKEFEDQWSAWLGVKHSVFVNSGSSANMITMAAIKTLYGAGEVLVPALTWESDIASILLAGHKPVFTDVGFSNLAMQEKEVLGKITEQTKAVFLTHILGFNGLTESFLEELKKRKILLIEDTCESHGARLGNQKCGAMGFASNFSFYYAHHMSTIEGGMVCTNDDEFYQYLRMYRSHGMLRESTDLKLKEEVYQNYPDLNPEFIFTIPGFNMRSTELNAVIGLNQLKRLDQNNKKRQENFQRFLEGLDPEKYYTDFQTEGSVNYALVLLLKKKDPEFMGCLMRRLKEEHVEFRRGMSGGGNQTRQPYVKEACPEIRAEDYPQVDFIHFYGMYLGNYPDLETGKIKQLCDLLNQI